LARAEPAQRALCKGALIGVTGFNPAQIRILECLSEAVPWALVSNFSAGVHLFEEMLRATTSDGRSVVELARTLGFDLALWESHHTRKVDSPSGTAKSLADAAGIPHERIATTRVGAVVGEHVIFASAEGEELRFQHVAHTRVLFARGAVLMAERLSRANLAPSRYEKADILSLPEA
jgi:4-hydroxy-tetrahydrodipicolinate reductase